MRSVSTFVLLVAVPAIAAAEELTYAPNNDVTSHSTIALDQLDIKDLIDSGDVAGALDIYQNGKNREGKSLQQMAQKDWAAAGLENLDDYDLPASLFNQGDGEPFLDSFNLDAMNCNRSFDGQTSDMCAISAKKNLLCTSLLYAQYEGISAIQYGNEKNWDELFAFWNGVYDPSIDERVNSGGPGAVQASRDSDFGTSFRQDSIKAIIDGQKAFSGSSVKTDKLIKAYEAFKKANLATFAQATLKYSALFDEEGLSQDKKDKKWGEGYTYFRCGAGLMDPELALYINYVLDPRDKSDVELTPKETLCKIVDKMLSLPEIGMGIQMGDLNVEKYLPTIKEDCGLANFKHAAGAKSKTESERAYIPVLGFLVVCGLYFAFYSAVSKKKTA